MYVHWRDRLPGSATYYIIVVLEFKFKPKNRTVTECDWTGSEFFIF
jgi:hypothetical protein